MKNYSSSNGAPLYMGIYEHYRQMISIGVLREGMRLPSVRQCAQELGVSRTTVENAYFYLAADGYIISKPQSGYFVTHTANYKAKGDNENTKQKEPHIPILFDFSSSGVDSESFDFNLWRRYIKSALRQDERLLSYGEPQGERDLREAVADYIGKMRNVVCTADEIVIGAGVQSLLHILCRLIQKKTTISFLDKSFRQGISVFSDHGFTPLFGNNEAQILYVSPSHMTRWGDVMPVSIRMELLKKAKKNGSLIIEDDYNNEFRYHKRPMPSLQSLAGGENVVYLGTFSKLLLPSIRISYMVLPKDMARSYAAISDDYNQTTSKTEQLALCSFIRDGHLSAQMRKTRKIYTSKAKSLCEEIEWVFGDLASVSLGETGFHVRLIINTRRPAREIAKEARSKGVAVIVQEGVKEDQYQNTSQLLLSCSAVSTQDFPKALAILKSCC